jgi:hypothetical protein
VVPVSAQPDQAGPERLLTPDEVAGCCPALKVPMSASLAVPMLAA